MKSIWTNNDFEEMSWHDCAIYSISLPQDNQFLIFDIDYITEWKLNKSINLFNFFISPCTLTFESVLNLRMTIDFQDSIGISINEIRRENPQLSSNQQFAIWTYIIETDKGEISFTSTGFEQILRQQPVFSESVNLGRDIKLV